MALPPSGTRPPPSVGALVRAISDEAIAAEEAIHAVPQAVFMQLPKPRPITWILTIFGGGLALIVAGLTLVMVRAWYDLGPAIAERERAFAHPAPPPLPTDEGLLDDEVTAIYLKSQPTATARLFRARAHALQARGDFAGAIAAWLEIQARVVPWSGEDRLGLAEALAASGRTGEAIAVLRAVPLAAQTGETRSAVLALLTRCQLTARATGG